jgi:sulfoxide reductase heme-binding subunit YedZ
MNVWITARAAGYAALLLLTASVCLGALSARRAPLRGRIVSQYVHRGVATLALPALVMHVVGILLDSYAHVGLIGALIPLRSGYRPGWVALGTGAVYATVLVAALGWARGRLATSPRAAAAWRAVHCLAYAGWAAAMLHGLNAGTDSGATWARLGYGACLVAVIISVAVRLPATRRAGGLVRPATAARPALVRTGPAR